MNLEELNKRCNEVFLSKPGDYYYSVEIINDDVVIQMEEEDGLIFNYVPDMSERPQALDYLLGKRDDFND